MEPNPQNLEELIHRELAKLPERQAPPSLVPRVLARIQAQEQRRWWQRPWSSWPRRWQLAFLPVVGSCAAGAVLVLFFLESLGVGQWSFEPVWKTASFISGLWDVLSALGSAVLILARSAAPNWFWGLACLPVLLYLVCIGLGTLCFRVAVSRRTFS